MSADKISISKDLLHLKPFAALESMPMSKLARQGSAVLQQIISTSQAMAVKVQGQGAMVTLSQRQYDEMVELIQAVQLEKSNDGFTESLSQQFDELMIQMNQPDADKAAQAALFGTPATLNKVYQSGATESKT